MKKILFLAFILQYPFLVDATSINVSGSLNTNTHWTGIDTVKLIGNVTVEEYVTLTIDPGIVVEAQGMYALAAKNGQIKAIGTKTDSIVFTAKDKVSGWNRVSLNGDAGHDITSEFQYCVFEYGKPETGNGGAMMVNSYNEVILQNCMFRYNTNINSILTVQYGALTLNACTFYKNSGVSLTITSLEDTGYILGCTFIENSGYAVLSTNNTIDQYVNNLFINNSGVFAIYNSSPTLINNTITGSQNEGIFLNSDSDPKIYNSIIYDNNKNVFLQSKLADPDFYNCDIEGGKDAFSGTGAGSSFEGAYTNCIDENPKFADPSTKNFKLQASSPCINKGTASGIDLPDYDIYGNNRVINSVVDIGAYEFKPTPIVITLEPEATNTLEKTILLTISSNLAIAGLELNDFVITNGTVSNLQEVTPGTEYTVEVTATDFGSVTIKLLDEAVKDDDDNVNLLTTVTYAYSEVIITEIEKIDSNSILFYPNPATNYFTLETEGLHSVEIISAGTGNTSLVYKNVHNGIFDISQLPKGLYLVKVETMENVGVYRLVKY